MNWNDNRRRDPLPIDDQLEGIIALSRKNRVVVVKAETGGGKTTRVVQEALLSDPNLRIVMTQTRRPAVRWNGRRIAQEMGCQPGELVGWSLFGENKMISHATRLEIIVTQSLVNRIRRNGGKLPDGLIIVDEAHDRSVDLDLLLGLIKEGLPTSPRTRVIVLSATIDTQKFSAFFDDAPVVSVSGRCYPVATEVVRLEYSEHHSQGAARAAGMVLKRFADGTLVVPDNDGTGTRVVTEGTVIVLLPGKEDIVSVAREIRATAETLGIGKRVEAIACHSESTDSEQDAVLSPVPAGTLRFVCGTEVLRSSVTVPGTCGVIDSLQVKRMITDERGVAHLAKVPVSAAEADQGKGRAGRTGSGFYMPISYKAEFESLRPWPQPAILREPMANVALQVADIGRNVRDFAFIDAPPAQKVEVALARLKALGALDAEEKITEVGKLLVRFPIDPERAKVLVTAEKLGVLPEAVVVTAILETEGIFHRGKPDTKPVVVDEFIVRVILSRYQKESWGDYWKKRSEPIAPAETKLDELPNWITRKDGRYEINPGTHGFPDSGGSRWIADLLRSEWAGASKSDFVASVRAYRAFKTEEWRLRDDRSLSWRDRDDRLYAWCVIRGVNIKRLRLAEDTMRQIREEVASSPLRLENGFAIERKFDGTALTKALASGMVDNLLRRNGRYEDDYRGRLGSIKLADESACPAGRDLVLVSGARKVPTRRGREMLLSDLAAPVEPEWVAEVMPHLCEQTRQGDHRYDPETDRVVEGVKSVFQGDLHLGTIDTPSAKEDALPVLSAWLAEQMTA